MDKYKVPRATYKELSTDIDRLVSEKNEMEDEIFDLKKQIANSDDEKIISTTIHSCLAEKEKELEMYKADIKDLEQRLKDDRADNHSLLKQLAERDAVLERAEINLNFIADREDFTFAECSLAEEIVSKAKESLAEIRKLLGKS